jgi:glycosyltransferase involved in cell wall biosynthesis
MNQNIRLLYVTTLPFSQWWFLRGQNNFLAEKGFELHSITSKGKYFEELAQRDQMTMHPVEIPRSIVPHRDLMALIKMFFIIRRIKPHIVHLSNPKAALLGSVAAWTASAPIRIFFIRGLTSDAKTGLSQKIYETLEWLTARFCNVHYCESNSLLTVARSKRILRSEEGEVILSGMFNGVDCAQFDPDKVSRDFNIDALRESLGIPRGAKLIGFVGRLARDKGLKELAEAWKEIRESVKDSYLLFVGDWWDEVDVIENEIKDYFIQDPRVRITGYVENPAPYYLIMDVLVLPSYREGFPTAVMEASAMGIPVISTKVTGCTDAVLDGLTGTLIPPHNSEALKKALRKYLDNPQLASEHGKNGQIRVREKFRSELIWNALREEYRRLIKERSLYR